VDGVVAQMGKEKGVGTATPVASMSKGGKNLQGGLKSKLGSGPWDAEDMNKSRSGSVAPEEPESADAPDGEVASPEEYGEAVVKFRRDWKRLIGEDAWELGEDKYANRPAASIVKRMGIKSTSKPAPAPVAKPAVKPAAAPVKPMAPSDPMDKMRALKAKKQAAIAQKMGEAAFDKYSNRPAASVVSRLGMKQTSKPAPAAAPAPVKPAAAPAPVKPMAPVDPMEKMRALKAKKQAAISGKMESTDLYKQFLHTLLNNFNESEILLMHESDQYLDRSEQRQKRDLRNKFADIWLGEADGMLDSMLGTIMEAVNASRGRDPRDPKPSKKVVRKSLDVK